MRNVVMLSVAKRLIMLSVFMLNVVMEYRDAFVNYEQKMFYSIGLRNFKMSKKYFRILKVSGLTHKNTRPC